MMRMDGGIGRSQLTTLVPRLTFRVYLSALVESDQEAWKAVYHGQRSVRLVYID